MATAAQRQHVAAVLTMLQAHAGQLDYPPHDDRGPADAATFRLTEQQATHVLNDGGRLNFDCSEECTVVLKWIGCADPNGLGYRYAGYTGTMLAHLGKTAYTDPKLALTGAIVIFGPGTGHHCALVWTPDPVLGNPWLGSHGRPGFERIRLKDEAARQAAMGYPGVTLLSIAHL